MQKKLTRNILKNQRIKMVKVKKEDILINPDQIPQARKLSVMETSIIVNNVKEKQQKVLM